MKPDELKNALKNYNRMVVWQRDNETSLIAITIHSEGMEDVKERLIASNKYYQNMINEVQEFIQWLEEPTKSMVVDKYFKEVSNTDLELDYGYCRSHINDIIWAKIESYIKFLHVG